MKKLISIILVFCMLFSFSGSIAFAAPSGAKSAASSNYSDVPSTHWAYKVISTLSDKGVLGGFEDGTFRPDNLVTRAEFSKMIAIFMNLSISTSTVSSFSDVPNNHWALKYIETDKVNDLISGYPDGTYKPDNSIKRSEVARIIVSANEKLNAKATKSTASTKYVPFSDIKGNWAENDIVRLREIGVADAYPDGLFRPERLCTRAEAAKLLYLLLQNVLGEKVTPETTTTVALGSNGGRRNNNPDPNPCGGLVTPYEAAGTINENGGVVEVTDPSSPLYGAKIDAPAGAVPKGKTITVAIGIQDELPGSISGDAIQSSKTIVISKDTCCNFRIPVKVTVPYLGDGLNDNDEPSMFYWQPTYKRYVAVGVKEIQRPEPNQYTSASAELTHSITFSTVHSGQYVALAIPGLGNEMQYGESTVSSQVDTGFVPNKNGFDKGNSGSYAAPGGNSIGMINYATYHYTFKTDPVDTTGTALFGKYGDQAQTELIQRAFLASSNSWNATWKQRDNLLDAADNAIQLVQTMKITSMPQTLAMTGKRNSTDADPASGIATMVYSFDPRTDTFGVYDPNFPGESNTIRWNGSTFIGFTKGAAYAPAFDDFDFEAISSSVEPGQYDTLGKGADTSFPTSDFGEITITSPTTDTLESTGTVTLSGYVTGGKINPKYIVYNQNGADVLDAKAILLGSDGSFSFDIDINGSHNSIMLYASELECPTIARCAMPYSAYKEIRIRVKGTSCFSNLGFESGDLSGWNHKTFSWSSTATQTPEKSDLISIDGFDPYAKKLKMIYSGQHSFRVNSGDNGYHISEAVQTITVPNAICGQLRFNWAAVMEFPSGHASYEQPYVDISVKDETTGEYLYNKHFYSGDTSYSGWIHTGTFNIYGEEWLAIDWQTVTVDMNSAPGHDVTIRVQAADCSLSGHGGYAYLDAEE